METTDFSSLDVTNFEKFAVHDGRVVFKARDRLVLVEGETCFVFPIEDSKCSRLSIRGDLVFYGDAEKPESVKSALDIRKRQIVKRETKPEITVNGDTCEFEINKLTDKSLSVYVTYNRVSGVAVRFPCEFRPPFAIEHCSHVQEEQGDCHVFKCYDYVDIYYLCVYVTKDKDVRDVFIVDFLLHGAEIMDHSSELAIYKYSYELPFEVGQTVRAMSNTCTSVVRVNFGDCSPKRDTVIVVVNDDECMPLGNSASGESNDAFMLSVRLISKFIRGMLNNLVKRKKIQGVKIEGSRCTLEFTDDSINSFLLDVSNVNQKIVDKLLDVRKKDCKDISCTDFWVDGPRCYVLLPIGIGILGSAGTASHGGESTTPQWYSTSPLAGKVRMYKFFPRRKALHSSIVDVFNDFEGDIERLIDTNYKDLGLDDLIRLPTNFVERVPAVIRFFFDALLGEGEDARRIAITALQIIEYYNCAAFYHYLILYLISKRCDRVLVLNIIMRVYTDGLFELMERFFADKLCEEFRYLFYDADS